MCAGVYEPVDQLPLMEGNPMNESNNNSNIARDAMEFDGKKL